MHGCIESYEAETVKLGVVDVTIRIECYEETAPIEGNACACGECTPDCDTYAREYADRFWPWGWCAVRVVAGVGGYEGDDWLGGCTYESGRAFMATSGYYDDMRDEAIKRLWERLVDAVHVAKLAGI